MDRKLVVSRMVVGLMIAVGIMAACSPAARGAATEAAGGYVGDVEAAPQDMLMATAPPPALIESEKDGLVNQSVGDQNISLPIDRMIIKKAEIDLLVASADAAIDQVTQIATDNGGYIISNQSALEFGVRNGIMTIAVPVDRFEDALRRLRGIALEVQRELASGEDVSSEFVDLESRLRNLEATRDRIKDFLDKAKSVEEALQINQQLSDIESEIEQVKGRMNYLSGRAAFSTITVTLRQKTDATPTPTPTSTPTPTPTPPWSLGPTVEEAANTQLLMVQGLLEFFTWLLIVPGPYLLVMGLIAWALRKYLPTFKKTPPPDNTSK